ncbi:MAG TPA: DNA polymerase ligase N-terminal domain-containing protein [Nitrososphaerales archaeon]|nr:DNA polymerase ligase N-terminal domain-containing protein [Nitrososphaerales archaeon]
MPLQKGNRFGGWPQGEAETKLSRGLFAFVVQKHKATALHYDFRLEIEGGMPSWSIPKGPSLDPSVKRLALPTGSHEMDYRNFEGVIAGGNYGAGAVMIWDEGTYSPEIEVDKGVRTKVTHLSEATEVAIASLRDGNVKFTLYGKKLHGSFALVRTIGLGSMKEAWLLIKHRDEYCKSGYDANDYDFSARTKRSLAQIAAQG